MCAHLVVNFGGMLLDTVRDSFSVCVCVCVCVCVFSVSHLKGKIIFQVISSKAWRGYCILLNIVDLLKDQTC